MDPAVSSFDPNDLICYSPEGSEGEDEPPPEQVQFQRPNPPGPLKPKRLSPLHPLVTEDRQPIDLDSIAGEEIQLTVPGVSATTETVTVRGAHFKCKFCPAITQTAEDFIKHFIMHFGRNRISYKQMTQEEIRNLPNTSEKFVCGICAICFDTREAVKQHMIKDHGFKELRSSSENRVEPSVPVPLAKTKLDSESVDSTKLLASSSGAMKDSEPPIKKGIATVTAIGVAKPRPVPILSTPSQISVSSVVVCDKEILTKSSTIQPQPKPNVEPPSLVPILPPPVVAINDQEDPELNEFLQPMTLRALKLKLLAGLKLKCPQKGCVYKFETRAKRDAHLKCHNIEPPQLGPGGPVPSVSVVGTGAKDATKEEKKDNFKCYQCGMDFPRWRECSQHIWKQHKLDVGMLKCPVCDVRFEFAVKVYRHLQTHRPVKTFTCPSCGKSFATQSQLSVHEALHKKQQLKGLKTKPATTTVPGTGPSEADEKGGPKHGDHDDGNAGADDEASNTGPGEGGKPGEKLPWYAERKCDICGHMFSNSKILSKHIKTVHHKIKPFICSVCGYKSARKVTLTIHMRQHSGQKPLECKECPFRTADPSALKYHEKRHTKDKYYECKHCGLLTIQASALKTHIRLNHPEEFKSLKCEMCNFTSVNPEILARHKSDHKAGLIKSEDSHDSVSSKRSKNAPESSSDCFLPIESTDSVVHDAGGFTIPAVINAPVAHSEETQFPT
ncbi:zinc finger protein 543-like [Uranotaenia lowii]|uniref:zinc finger protein 543-like n=1 Tax=Uranotaenia lowii TaxID=190385 RepID=UPI002478E659|nr:zinc finger protein 543-like [Uranotaenia lowii]